MLHPEPAQLMDTSRRAAGARPGPADATRRSQILQVKQPEQLLWELCQKSQRFSFFGPSSPPSSSLFLHRELWSVLHRLSMSAVAQIPLLWFLGSIPEL